jgi:hypothetical protein
MGHLAPFQSWDVETSNVRVYTVLVEKPIGKQALGKPRRRWEDSIKRGLTVKVGSKEH